MDNQAPTLEFMLYNMSFDGEMFKIAMPDKSNPEVYGLRLTPIEENLPELFVWCYYHPEQKCFVHTLSDVWSGYKLTTHREYGERDDLEKLNDWNWLNAILMVLEIQGKLQAVMTKRTEFPMLNNLSAGLPH